MFSWFKPQPKWVPTTGRTMIIAVFQLALVIEGAIALYEMFVRSRFDISASAVGIAFGTTIAFPLVYGLYCNLAPGELHPDMLNKEKPPTGRTALRFMGVFCACLLLLRCIAGASDFDMWEASTLFGVFATIFCLGVISRVFAKQVNLPMDQGIIGAERDDD